jgi:O-acetylhomoserine (thiol)-lyase
MRTETLAVHGGHEGDPAYHAVAIPIHQTAAYEFESADHAAALFNLEGDGYRYSRISNPTVAALERRLALLERGVDAVAVGSGQAALHYAVMNLVEPGRNIVSTPHIYGTTHTLFSHFLPGLGVQVRFAASSDPDDLARLIDGDTRALFCESIGNPAGTVSDIEALARIAHAGGVPLIVDNTVASPVLLRPIEWGADIVVHSLTKFLGGHGTTLGGAIIDGGTFDWTRAPDRYAMFNRPDPSYHGLVYAERFGVAAYAARCRSTYLRVTGAALSPISAFQLLQGIETVAIRVDRHVENARRVAHFLRADPRVDWVNYAGFTDNPSHGPAMKYLGGRASSVFTFGVAGGLAAAKRVYDALGMIKRVVNLGDVRSLACHPASTTHRQMTREQQYAAGIQPEAIRISVGIEHADDIIDDLNQALAAAVGQDAFAAELV